MSQSLESLLVPPNELSQLDIPQSLVVDIILRHMFSYGEVTGNDIQQVIRLTNRVVDELLGRLQQEHVVEVRGGTTGLGRSGYVFALTEEGKSRARDAFDRSLYIGSAPVPLDKYSEAILVQTSTRQRIAQGQIQQALKHLVLPSDFHRLIGPAINSGSSMFLYGSAGNGKTTIAQAIGKLVSGADPIWLPFSITVAGQIIQVYDPIVHKIVESPDRKAVDNIERQTRTDARWSLCERPFVMTGGELGMESLELRFDGTAKFYEAPLQMKANGGMFLIDDFGRQRMSPIILLNRWIVPLETQFDLLRLRTGQSFQVPFREFTVFSTNLNPETLVDDAFLRRIQVKVEVTAPDEKMFYQIFLGVCKTLHVPFDKASFVYLLQEWYGRCGRRLQSVHPRDILRGVVALCEYENVPYRLTPELIDEACRAYFVQSPVGKDGPSTPQS